ncbi:unnamed protein product [Paramecium sonneborni]|uniref:Uncharacterized protein n=1 Tax=Paramecium sonneborni TaxID=65129 RepID=A0A8S1RVX0_9CILI|nr:unnamed protein product [Paramecium sonneborni]
MIVIQQKPLSQQHFQLIKLNPQGYRGFIYQSQDYQMTANDIRDSCGQFINFQFCIIYFHQLPAFYIKIYTHVNCKLTVLRICL